MWQNQGRAYAEECPGLGISPESCSLSDKLWLDFRSTNGWWILAVCVLLMISNVFRSLRWKMMVDPMGYDISPYNSFFAVMIAYLANLGIPRSGEFFRAGILSKYEKVPFEKGFGTIVQDRILDLICLATLIGLGFILYYNTLWNYFNENLSVSTQTLIAISGMAVIGMLGLGGYIRYIGRTDESKLSPIAKKIKIIFLGFVEGLGSIRKIPNLPVFLLYTAGIWICYVLTQYFALLSFGSTSHLGLKDALLIFDFGALGIVFPSPGGLGSFHAMIVEVLKILKVDALEAFSFAMILFFIVNIFCNVAFGIISLILLPIYNRNRLDN